MLRKYLLVLVISNLTCLSAYAKETLSIRADEWCPYNCDPTAGNPGFMVEIVTEIFSQKGIEIDYKLLNWARAVQDTERGDYDAIIGATKDDAPNFIFPTEKIGDSKNCFYTKPESKWEYKGIKSLENIILGVIKGYSYFEELDNYVKSPANKKKIDENFGEDVQMRLINKLHSNRMDAFVENENVIQYMLTANSKEIGSNKIKTAGCAPVSQSLFIAFSPKKASSKARAEMFDNGLKEMKKNGKLTEITKKYGIKKFW